MIDIIIKAKEEKAKEIFEDIESILENYRGDYFKININKLNELKESHILIKPLKLKFNIELELLQKIAEYYRFPLAVFFGNLDVFKNTPKTRDEAVMKKAEKFDKIKEVVDDD